MIPAIYIYRRNFDPDKKNETITIANFGYELLLKLCPVKFANFVYICITLATNLCSFTHSKTLFLAVVLEFRSSCLDQNLVYSWNHPFMFHNDHNEGGIIRSWLKGMD